MPQALVGSREVSVMAFLGMILVSVSIAMSQNRPMALSGLESSSTRLMTGHVRWVVRSHEGKSVYGRERHFVSRFAGDQFTLEDWGDSNGVVQRDPDGSAAKKPDPRWGYSPLKALVFDAKQWEHVDGSPLASVFPGRNDLLDVRVLGAAGRLTRGQGVREIIWGRKSRSRYDVREVGELIEVKRTVEDNKGAIRWLLDPRRGWGALKIEIINGDSVVAEAHIVPDRFGDVWFPRRVEYYKRSNGDAMRLIYTVEVTSASFNRPDHPRRLDPGSIGIEVGTNIQLFNNGNPPQVIGRRGWDGEALVPLQQLFERVNSGELTQGPEFTAEMKRIEAAGHNLSDLRNRWEIYTRNFIRKYALKAEQAQRAFSILDDCLERASALLAHRETDITRIRAAVAKLDNPADRKQLNRSAELEKYREEMKRLQAPIWKVYHTQLVQRLEQLPTRSQRGAAEVPAAKSPRP